MQIALYESRPQGGEHKLLRAKEAPLDLIDEWLEREESALSSSLVMSQLRYLLPLLTTDCLLLTTHYLLPTTYYLLITAYYLLLTSHFSLQEETQAAAIHARLDVARCGADAAPALPRL